MTEQGQNLGCRLRGGLQRLERLSKPAPTLPPAKGPVPTPTPQPPLPPGKPTPTTPTPTTPAPTTSPPTPLPAPTPTLPPVQTPPVKPGPTPTLPQLPLPPGQTTPPPAGPPAQVGGGQSSAPTYSPTNEELLQAGEVVEGKDGRTKIAVALQKHSDRTPTVYPPVKGNPKAVNEQGRKILADIVNDPAAVRTKPHYSARYGGYIIEVILPDGRGARFMADGTKFIGLLEP